jgi:LPXTG-site transpeptidase (sortase) family protein
MVKVDFSKRKTLLLGVFLFFLLASATTIYFFFLRDTNDTSSLEAEELEVVDIVTESLDIPDESEPKEFYVPPDLPKILTIPSISVRGYIQSVGTDQDNLIAVPTNVHLAGWYINSAKPGEVGLSIIDGHRDGTTMGGIFRNLERLKKGEKITVEYGDGSLKEFEVVDLKTLSIEDAYDFMYSRIGGVDIQLNLVTCGGKWSNEINTYEDRIIVRAKGI